MRVFTHCSSCESELPYDSETDHDTASSCPNCNHSENILFSDSIRQNNVVDCCPSCGKRAFYIQKDFSRNLGLGIVVVCALVGLYFVWQDQPFLFYAALGVAVLADGLLYMLLPEVTVCYACETVFRGADKNQEHVGFDLHIADIYEGRSQGHASPDR